MNFNKTFRLKNKKDKHNGTDMLEIDNKRVRMLKQLIDDTGAKVWCVNGSRYIPLSEDEALCVNAICQYGKFVNSSIRM